MIKRILPFLTLLLPLSSIGQTLPDSIIVNSVTYINNFPEDSLYRVDKFSVARQGNNYRLNHKSVNQDKVIEFLRELSSPNNLTNSLTKYDIDTTWIKNNPEQLLKLYPDKDRVEWNQEQRAFIYNKLTNIRNHQRQLDGYLGSGCCYSMHNGYRYQFQIKIYTNGRITDDKNSRKRAWGYYYPWTNSKSDTLYTYKIEDKLNKLLSFQSKVKAPMTENKLLKYLTKNIIDDNMQALYKLSAYSYINEINELKSDFEVFSFEEVYAFGRYTNEPKTIKIQLKSNLMSKNVTLNFMASKSGNTIYSRDSIKKEHKTITSSIQSIDFINNYITQNPKSKLDIYYFNNRGVSDYNIDGVNKNPEEWAKHDNYVESLKWYEKSSIKPSFDLNEAIKTSRQNHCGCNYRFDRAFIEKAIFFEIIDEYENRSIWFLLPDNTLLLYIMSGDKLLDHNYTDFRDVTHLRFPCVLFDAKGQRIKK